MREYGRVAAVFWQRGSGKRLRGDPEAQVVALYLLSCASANSSGLYYLPIPTIAHEIGSPIEGASKALARVCAAGFADYDEANELVWVPNMALLEIGAELNGKDKRKPHIEESLAKHNNHPFVKEFYGKYGAQYGLETPKPLGSPFEGPYKPLRSQFNNNALAITNSMQDHEIPREQKPKRERKPKAPDADAPVPGSDRVVEAWFQNYEAKYKQKPKWGGRQGKQLKALLKGSGYTVDELVALVPYYFAWQRPEVIKAGHPWGTGYACFVMKLDELRADIADQDRRKGAAVIAEREKLHDSLAIDDDEVNRINALNAAQRNPFDERQWRSVGEIGPAGPGPIDQGNQAALGGAQQALEPSGRADVVPSTGAVRKTGGAMASAGSVLRGKSVPVDRPGQGALAWPSRDGSIQADSGSVPGTAKAR